VVDRALYDKVECIKILLNRFEISDAAQVLEVITLLCKINLSAKKFAI